MTRARTVTCDVDAPVCDDLRVNDARKTLGRKRGLQAIVAEVPRKIADV